MKKVLVVCLLLAMTVSVAYAAVDTNTYLAFGDSITHGTFTSGNNGIGGYPAKLSAMLGKTVANYGRNNEKTAEGISRLTSALAAVNAGCLLLMEGTNDIRDGVSTGTIKHNLGVMIDRANAHGTKVIISTLLPRRDGRDGRVQEVNNHIRSLAVEKNVYLIDMYAAFTALGNMDPYYFDLVHPTDAGYQVMADNWNTAIADSNSGQSPNGGGGDSGGGGGGGCGTIRPTKGQINGNVALLFVVFLAFLFNRFRTEVKYQKVNA